MVRIIGKKSYKKETVYWEREEREIDTLSLLMI